MSSVETRMCHGCGRLITFVMAPAGHRVPCDSFSVKVVPDKSLAARQFYIGGGKIIWGRKVAEDTPGAVSAWEPHNAFCARPKVTRKQTRKLSPDEVAELRRRNAEAVKRTEAALLAAREIEWAANGYGQGEQA